MSQAPKMTKKPTKPSAQPRKTAIVKAPLLGAKANHALFITKFSDAIRATLKNDWPPQVGPGIEVDTYEIDLSRQHIGSIPFRIDASAVTIRGECLAKQGQDQNAATQAWLLIEPNV